MAKVQSECDPDKPDEAFAWMFAAGVPDPRGGGGKFPNQPLVPPMCYGVLSEMLYKMGARFHPELQELWVAPNNGFGGNFQVSEVTDVKPEDLVVPIAEMVADQFPEVAERIKSIKPGTENQAVADQAKALMASLEKLRDARAKVGGAGG